MSEGTSTVAAEDQITPLLCTRIRTGLTIATISRLAGIAESTLEAAERGRRLLPHRIVRLLAFVLAVPIDELNVHIDPEAPIGRLTKTGLGERNVQRMPWDIVDEFVRGVERLWRKLTPDERSGITKLMTGQDRRARRSAHAFEIVQAVVILNANAARRRRQGGPPIADDFPYLCGIVRNLVRPDNTESNRD